MSVNDCALVEIWPTIYTTLEDFGMTPRTGFTCVWPPTNTQLVHVY